MSHQTEGERKIFNIRAWRKSYWHCRYCCEPMFFAPTLGQLEKLNPNHAYYHPHGKSGPMLDLFQYGWATIHQKATAVPATPINPYGDGSVSCCWKCNSSRSTSDTRDTLTPEALAERVNTRWDGLVLLHPRLPNANASWIAAIKAVYGTLDR